MSQRPKRNARTARRIGRGMPGANQVVGESLEMVGQLVIHFVLDPVTLCDGSKPRVRRSKNSLDESAQTHLLTPDL
jgi:hypothetical protein